MRSIACAVAVVALFFAPFAAADKPADKKPAVPDCLGSSNDWPGSYEVLLNIKGLSARQVFDFLSELSADPIWPEAANTNKNHRNRTEDIIAVVVKPNMNRFDEGTTLEQTGAKVEPAIRKLMKLKGVTVQCPEAGE